MRLIEQLEDRYRDELSVALHAFVMASDELIDAMWKVGPSESSRASAHLDAERTLANAYTGPTPVQDTHRAMLFVMISSIDHARSFVIQLDSAAVSLALSTTVRATLEASARVYWLLAGHTAQDLLHRNFSLIEQELKMLESIEPQQVLTDLSGTDVPLGDVRQRNLSAIRQLAPDGKPLACRPTKLATEMASVINQKGRLLYSSLSAVAHGEALGLHGFVENSEIDGRHFFRIKLPAKVALAYSEQVFSILALALKSMMEYGSFPRSSANEWGRLHDECLNTFTAIRGKLQ